MADKSLKRVCQILCLVAFIGFSLPNIAADKKGQDAKPFLPAPVSSKQSIRFYKANKQLQADRVMITADKAANPGCNNLLKKVRVFKALQIGFKSCSLYEKKNCDVGSLVPANNEKQERHTYLLSEGQAWFAQSEDERGADVRSWYCGNELENGELRAEAQLALRETSRLNKAKSLAQKKLAKAQANFDLAEKNLAETKDYRKRVKKKAITVGAIEAEENGDKEPTQDGEVTDESN